MNNQEFRLWCASDKASATDYLTKPLVIGILNATPDSFSNDGFFMDKDSALRKAEVMIAEGADLLDIGGESTRPNAEPVELAEELDRVIPLIEALRSESDICISIDTYKPEVMMAAVSAGAGLINDIRALSYSEDSLKTALTLKTPVCLMHMRGLPRTMQNNLDYSGSIMENLHAFFEEKIENCLKNGLPKELIILDPGFGFGKSVDHNLQIVAQFEELKRYQRPLMLGVSRKSTLGHILDKPVNERLIAGISLSVMALMGGANILRTHDIEETRQAVSMVEAVKTRGLL